MKKSILITGAGTGIGKDTAVRLAERGYKVYAATHTQQQAIILNNKGKDRDIPIYSFKLDINNHKERLLVHNYRIDVLINNAAIGETGSAAEIPSDRFKKPMETNVFSALALTQEVLRDMINNKKGQIIFITSLAGRLTMPFFSPYSASKCALDSIGVSLHDEMKLLRKLGINISVSIVEPGAYATGFNQKMMNKKYEWMDRKSYFSSMIESINAKEKRIFKVIEIKTNKSIVKKIIEAVESKSPKLRYSMPKLQAFCVQAMRMLGK